MEDVKPIKDGLCLITHPHLDHWDQELFEEMDHAIITPPDILENIKSDNKIPFDDIMTYKDMVVEAFETQHDGNPRNFKHYSYLVTWHGLRLYISGDTVVDHALTMKDIDIMFIPVWFTNKIRSQDLAIDAKTRVVFHQKQGQEIPPSQDYVVLKQGETLTVKFKQKEHPEKPTSADIVRSAAAEGKLAYKLTELEEMKALLGLALNESTKKDGGMEVLFLEYPDVHAIFGRMRNHSAPFTLLQVTSGDREVDIGQGRQITLRDENDIRKFDAFLGFANVSLVNVDLREHKKLLETMPFDSRTKWPESNKLPEGFNPVRLLEEGKNPGLGIYRLHKRGIDGRGVGIAILDQRLLKNHVEYANQLKRYEEIDVRGMPPQMHGAPVASIAVGKTCGVAPKTALSYFAMRRTAMPDNQIYCDIIDKIIESNESGSASERIRVVSISTGTFQQQANFENWKTTLKKAEQHGILVVTCAQDWLTYRMLARIPGRNPDDPNSYRSGKYGVRGALLVPAGNRTIASHLGPNIYTYWTEGGMSWAAPYLAGLAALAYQVDPEIEPKTIVELWLKTAVRIDAGRVVNPPGFIKAVQNNKK
jgi:hypothetical protein